MLVIRKLGDRVEHEHNQFLRDSQRIEDRSATATNGTAGVQSFAGGVDFENLVSRANGVTVKADTVIDSNKSWDDDVWGSIFNEDVSRILTHASAISYASLTGTQGSDASDCGTTQSTTIVLAFFTQTTHIPVSDIAAGCDTHTFDDIFLPSTSSTTVFIPY